MRIVRSKKGVPVELSSLRLMCVGHSMVTGDGNATGQASGIREPLYRRLRDAGVRVTMLGDNAIGPLGRKHALWDWLTASHGGYTIAQASAEAAASEALFPAVDCYVVMAGANDAVTDSGATMWTAMQACITARRAANPSAVIIVVGEPDRYSPAADYATISARMQAYRALLAAGVPLMSGCYYLDGHAMLGAQHIDSSGVHPTGQGYDSLGAAIADEIMRRVPLRKLYPSGQRICKRPAQAVAQFTDDTADKILLPDVDAAKIVGGTSFSFGMLVRPTALPAYQCKLFGGEGTYTNTVTLDFDSAGKLEAYVQVGTSYKSGAGAITANTWHAVALTADATTRFIRLYAGTFDSAGNLTQLTVDTERASVLWSLTSYRTSIGRSAASGFRGFAGQCAGFWLRNNAAATPLEIEDWVRGIRIPTGCSVAYPISEGSGTSIASAAGYGLAAATMSGAGSSWQAAGAIASPWDW